MKNLTFIAMMMFLAGSFIQCNGKSPKGKKTENESGGYGTMASKKKKGIVMKPVNMSSIEKEGHALWNSKNLGTTGKSCMTCHTKGAILFLNKPFPKHINMAKKKLTLKQMINFCIKNPLKGKAIDKNGKKMKAMAAYYHKLEEVNR